MRRRRPVRSLLRRAVLLLVAVAVAAPVLVGLQVWHVAGLDQRPSADAIVVLGAAQYNGEPSDVFTARLEHAAELYHADVASRIVTVGASLAGDNFTEAGTAARWLAEHADVPRGHIVAKKKGHDTLQSLRAADRAMQAHGWSSAVIVTDPLHSLRCRTMARDMGMRAATSPAREGNPMVGSTRIELRYLARETLAQIYYLLFRQSTDMELYSI